MQVWLNHSIYPSVEIICIRGNSDHPILPNVNTLQCIMTAVGANCKVSFDGTNSLASVLGFKRSIYGAGRHASVNSILVHCNIIHSSYMRGPQAPVAYNFFPNADPGKGTRSTTQFNLPPSNCRRRFNFVTLADGSTQKALGITWRGIEYTFSSS